MPDLMRDPEFRKNWEMTNLVALAEAARGEQSESRCFCLKIPSVLGGEYSSDNIGTIDVHELISFAGDLGRQIKDLPDGTTIRLNVDAWPTSSTGCVPWRRHETS
ncbi:MAG: DUF1851 domain-containing protein [Ignavibacteriae bacterium]|nr:DUF1851 domain-containing protein [Ignavibacteriota bacterium]